MDQGASRRVREDGAVRIPDSVRIAGALVWSIVGLAGVAALLTWVIYAAYFYARHNAGWKDRRSAWLLVGGFLSVIVTFVGADLLMPASRHSFLFGS